MSPADRAGVVVSRATPTSRSGSVEEGIGLAGCCAEAVDAITNTTSAIATRAADFIGVPEFTTFTFEPHANMDGLLRANALRTP